MTERKTRGRLTGGIIAVIVLAVCLVVTTVALAYSIVSVRDNTFATGGVRINLNDGGAGDPARRVPVRAGHDGEEGLLY